MFLFIPEKGTEKIILVFLLISIFFNYYFLIDFLFYSFLIFFFNFHFHFHLHYHNYFFFPFHSCYIYAITARTPLLP